MNSLPIEDMSKTCLEHSMVIYHFVLNKIPFAKDYILFS